MAKKKKRTSKKATEEAGSRPTEHQSGGGEGTANADDSRALPGPQVRVEDIEVLRAVIESHSALVDRRLDDQQQALERLITEVIAPVQTSLYGDSEMARLLATTSEIRERLARIEVGMVETQRRVTLMEENQRPPAPVPDREAAARKAALQWMLAKQCRASNLTRPTAAIVGRAMSDQRAFDQRAAKSPHVLFNQILDNVRRVFGLATPRPGQEATDSEQDYVHLTEDIVAIIQERSSRPKKKWAAFLNGELKPRLNLLVNSGLAHEVPNRLGKRTNYDRYLTILGREVFGGWPEWDDRTGGISLADELMPPDLESAGRPVSGATVPRESQPASLPRQPSLPPPAS